MRLAIDFDGTLVEDDQPYSDTTTPLRWKPGAKEALLQLAAAGHLLILWSGRSNRALLYSQEWDPLVRLGYRPRLRPEQEAASRELNWRRYRQMLDFVEAEAPGVFAYVDDGLQGKPSADVFIDDRALSYAARGGTGYGWPLIAQLYGEPVPRPAPLVAPPPPAAV